MSKENKTQPTAASAEQYIAGLEDEKRRADCLRLIPLFERISGEKATMWGPGIVGFGRYHYKYDSGREGDAPITAFAPRKQDLTIYVNAPAKEKFAEQLARLGKHKVSVSCLYLKRLADVDMDVLEEIVKESVRLTREQYPQGC
jgi:hypothetical protein